MKTEKAGPSHRHRWYVHEQSHVRVRERITHLLDAAVNL